MKNYNDLTIYQDSFDLALEIRSMSLQLKYPDKYEVGTQIRRSSQSIKDNIVEGYGRRKYKKDFVKHLIYSQGSVFEARSQAEFISRFSNDPNWDQIVTKLEILGAKIHKFIIYVETNWKS